MKQIIKNIFDESGFEINLISNDIYYCQKINSAEYFIIDFIDKIGIYNYADEGIRQEIIDLFESKKAERPDVIKNTSLIICIKVSTIKDDIEDIKNTIFKIEEDEYWFKKYVIIYTDKSLINLQENEHGTLDFLNTQLFLQDLFDGFKKDIFFNEMYFLVIQLFIKLPFLRVLFSEVNDFHSLRTILGSALTSSQISLWDYITQTEEMNNPESWNILKQAVLSLDGNEEVLNNFLQKYTLNV